jgi:hypothetical protein
MWYAAAFGAAVCFMNARLPNTAVTKQPSLMPQAVHTPYEL